MSALGILKEVRETGLALSISPTGKIAYRGPREAFERFAPIIREERDAILAALDEERRAGVVRLLDHMAAENARRRDWQNEPLQGWREGRLELRSAVTGEATVAHLPTRGRAR
jgi:hypothetical protein